MADTNCTRELITVHVDGSCHPVHRRSAVAAVVLSPDGESYAQAARQIRYCDPLEAELRALLYGLEFAQTLGLSEYRLRCDSKHAVELVRGNIVFPPIFEGHLDARCAKVAEKIQRRLLATPRVVVEWIPRKDNQRAHELAVEKTWNGRRTWAFESRPGYR